MTGFWDYIKAAFHLRVPIKGLGHVPVNYLGLAAFAVLGLVNPGWWFLGAACELGWLLLLGSNGRFQALVRGKASLKERESWLDRKQKMLSLLGPDSRRRYEAVERQCETVIHASAAGLTDAGAHGPLALDDFNQLLQIFYRLLIARQMLRKETTDPNLRKDIARQWKQTEERLKAKELAEPLRKSLEATKSLLERRVEILDTAEARLQYIDAELDRIEQQVALIGQESSTSLRDPAALSQRIDAMTTGLAEAGKWIKDLQAPMAAAQEALEKPMPMLQRKAGPTPG